VAAHEGCRLAGDNAARDQDPRTWVKRGRQGVEHRILGPLPIVDTAGAEQPHDQVCSDDRGSPAATQAFVLRARNL